jgi:hypothetical protein
MDVKDAGYGWVSFAPGHKVILIALAVLHLSYFQSCNQWLLGLWPGLHQQKSQEFELQTFVLQTNFNEL